MTHQTSPFVSLILLSYNSSDFTLACVQSIQEQTAGHNYEIIVVDNNSGPEEATKLEPLLADKQVKLVRSHINLGFSGGNMLGIQFARNDADYYFLLNNDTTLRNDVCGVLRTYMDAHSEVAVCTPQTVKPDGSFEPSFTYFPTLAVKLLGHSVLRKLSPLKYPSYKKPYDSPVEVPVVTGSAMFVRGSVFRQLGGLDITHFLYCEEEDFCQRVRRVGLKAALVPSAEFVHYAGGSGGQSLPVRKEFYISLFHYYRKYHNPVERAALRLFFAIKNGRKVFRDSDFGRLAWFILQGAPMRESLRYRQTIR